jgi:hypothetical protein
MTTPANENGSRVTPKQRRLTEKEIKSAKDAADAITGIGDWGTTPDGRFFWAYVVESLVNQATNGTSDGKPWVEPELTEADAMRRPLVMAKQQQSFEWAGPFVLIDKLPNGLFVTRFDDQKSVNLWSIARRATPEEIEAYYDPKLSS